MLTSLILSTIAFFVASHYIKRYAQRMDVPKGMALSVSVFVLALAVSYGVGYAVDRVVH